MRIDLLQNVSRATLEYSQPPCSFSETPKEDSFRTMLDRRPADAGFAADPSAPRFSGSSSWGLTSDLARVQTSESAASDTASFGAASAPDGAPLELAAAADFVPYSGFAVSSSSAGVSSVVERGLGEVRSVSAPSSSSRPEPLEGLRLGDRGPQVSRLQGALKRWNSQLDVGTPGVFDNKTRQALTLYKAIYGTGSTGQQVDNKTASYLRQMGDGTFWKNPPAKTAGQEMLYQASRKLGTPYVMGGDGQRSTDCGMLTRTAMVASNVSPGISRLADLQYASAKRNRDGLELASGAPAPGDLVFFRVPTSQSGIAVDGVTHVTMYVGDGVMLGASSSRGEVTMQPLSDLKPYVAGFGRARADAPEVAQRIVGMRG